VLELERAVVRFDGIEKFGPGYGTSTQYAMLVLEQDGPDGTPQWRPSERWLREDYEVLAAACDRAHDIVLERLHVYDGPLHPADYVALWRRLLDGARPEWPDGQLMIELMLLPDDLDKPKHWSLLRDVLGSAPPLGPMSARVPATVAALNAAHELRRARRFDKVARLPRGEIWLAVDATTSPTRRAPPARRQPSLLEAA